MTTFLDKIDWQKDCFSKAHSRRVYKNDCADEYYVTGGLNYP